MLGKLKGRKAQSTAEYAILIGLVVAVAIGMQTYFKRGIQGRVKDEADAYTVAIAADTNWGNITGTAATLSDQYEPEGLSSRSTQDMSVDDESSRMAAAGTVVRTVNQTTAANTGDFQEYDY